MVGFAVREFALAEEDEVEEVIVKAWRVEDLPLVEVDDRTEVQDCLDSFNIELSKYGMEAVEAGMRDVQLDLLFLLVRR